jgi:hypothetical protein
MAQHSDTSEFRLFKKLANPLQVDFSTKNQRPPMFPHGEAEEVPSSDDDEPTVMPRMQQMAPVAEEYEDEDEDEDEEEDYEQEDAFPAPEPPLQEEINREKQGYLLELEKLRQQGVQLTKTYTMQDTLEEIQYEYERIKMNQDSINAVNFMRDVMKLALTGVELANAKLGPVLHLDGWSKEVTSDMHRYDHCLERLYKKHWRKGSMSPESELLFLLLGSMIMYHFKSKYFGGTTAAAPAAHASAPPAMPRMPPPAAPGGRPIMRAPTADASGGAPPGLGGLGGLGGGGGGMPPGLMSMVAKML